MARNQPRRKPPMAERLAGDQKPPLEWTRGDNYFIHSGPYLVCKAWTANGWRYVASMKKQIISIHDTAEAARAACDAHEAKA